MARPRKSLTPAQEALLEKMAKSGASAQQISDALGGAISRAVAGRRVAAILGARRSGRAGNVDARLPDGPVTEPATPPEPSPEDDIADLDSLIEELAGPEGVMPTKAAALRLRLQAIALRAKLKPPEPPDTDKQPDMIAAAKRARDKLHELLERAVRGAA